MDCTYRKKTREFIGIHRKEIAESEGGNILRSLYCFISNSISNNPRLDSLVSRPAVTNQPMLTLLNIYTSTIGLMLTST